MLSRVKNLLPHNILKTLYYSMIQSHINYALKIWGNASSIGRVFKLQKRALRIINHTHFRSHTGTLFFCNNILKIHDLYETQIALFMFDYFNSNLPESFVNFFAGPATHSYQTRARPSQLRREFSRTKFTEKLPKHTFPQIWSKFQTISATNSRNQFLSKIKEFFLNIYKQNINVTSCGNPLCPDCG